MTYDWRLAVPLLEQRDGYFTKLKAAIEGAHKLHKEKVSSMPLAASCKMFKTVHFWPGLWLCKNATLGDEWYSTAQGLSDR